MSIARTAVLVGALSTVPPALQAQTAAGFTPGSFRVTESGAAEYRIPIQVAPGIAGMEPKLALVYNSQGGNGLLGVGWSLEGLSSITRCPRTMAQDGVRGGVNYDWNDRYCLDGQRLILVSPPPASYGDPGAEYRTERESFSKVISYGVVGNGPVWFRVWTKSGQILDYGSTDDSRIEAQGKSPVRTWAVNKIADTKGNDLTVTYTKDPVNGEFWPARIDYTASAGTGPSSSVRFAYESRTDVTPQFHAGSVMRLVNRLKRVETYVGSSLIREYRAVYDNEGMGGRSRLTSISECTGGACLSTSTVGWAPAANAYAQPVQWASSTFNPGGGWFSTTYHRQVFVIDVNGDGLPDILGITDDYVGVQLNTGAGCGPKVQWASSTFNPNVGWFSTAYHPQVFVVDVNGDGLPDILGITDDYVGVQLNTGSSFGPKVQWASSTFNPNGGWFSTAYHPQVFVVDVNGDGLPDILGITDDYIGVQLNTGSGFGPKVQWASSTFNPNGGWFSRAYHPQVFMVDVNGDGLPDILGITDDYIGVQLNTGSSFEPKVQWASSTFNPAGGWFSTAYHRQLFIADVNGDRLPDILAITDDYIGVQLNKGFGFEPKVQWASSTFNPAGGWFSTAYHPQVFVVDVNGDGLPDILAITDDYVGVQLNTGSGFGPKVQWASSTFNPRGGWFSTAYHAQIFITDANGDGLPDVLAITDDYVGVQSTSGPSGFRSADRLLTVDNGFGHTTSVQYKPLTDITTYVKDNAASYPVNNFSGPLYVVSNSSSSDGIGGTLAREHKYGGMRIDVGTGRGSLGFRWTEASQPSTGLKVRTEYRQDWPYVGMSSLVRKSQSSGAVLSEVTNTPACKNPDTGSPCTVAAGNRYFSFVSTSVESGNDLNGSVLPTVTTTTQYDTFGNAQSVAVSTGDGHSKATTNEYHLPDTAKWLLGRLKSSTVQSTMPAP
jgi:virulence plasmid B protein/VCBS repeat protein